jgi:hypothetical protein
LLVLEPAPVEAPLLLPEPVLVLDPGALLEPDAPERLPALHSSRLIWPSWFLSSLSNDGSPLAPDEELPPAAEDLDDCAPLAPDEALPPVAEDGED